jgi:hypothetical protein
VITLSRDRQSRPTPEGGDFSHRMGTQCGDRRCLKERSLPERLPDLSAKDSGSVLIALPPNSFDAHPPGVPMTPGQLGNLGSGRAFQPAPDGTIRAIRIAQRTSGRPPAFLLDPGYYTGGQQKPWYDRSGTSYDVPTAPALHNQLAKHDQRTFGLSTARSPAAIAARRTPSVPVGLPPRSVTFIATD